MKKACLALVVAMAAAGLVWAAQEKGQEGHPMAKLSKEHEMLKEGEGTWDYVMKFRMAPDQPEMEAKGTEVCSMVGGFWMVFDTKSPDFMGAAWHGHGSIGFDPDKKKYIGIFINSHSPYAMMGEGTSDGPNKMTLNWEGKHGDQVEKSRSVHEKKDKDHSVMTMYGPGPDGKEMTYFTITYTRKGAK